MTLYLPLYTNARFQSTQTHALLCLNNLISNMDTEAIGGPDQLFALWQGLLQMATAQSGE